MDWNKLQHQLFAMDPVDPREDIARLKAQAQGSAGASVNETVDYLQESVAVPEGSLQMDRNYSVDDFAALAGIVNEKKQHNADQVRGSEPMPAAEPGRKKHPYQDRLVGEDEDTFEGLRVVDTGGDPAQALQQSFSAIDSQLKALSQAMQSLNQTITQVSQLAQQMQQQMQQQQQQASTQRAPQAQSARPQTMTQSKKFNKQPIESIDNIKDSLYAALNKKMGN
jgi:DNA anti-recombination protein RmuC